MVKRTCYMGIDIAEGSPLGSKKPKYSVVIIDEEGRPLLVNPSVPMSRVIRLAWDYKPVKIGIDNPFELAKNTQELEKVLSLFPPESEIIQVTLSQDGQLQRMKTVAREHGLEVGKGKLSSVRTAFLLAYLAKEGEGSPIRFIEEKTIIVVSKARSPKGGGFSQQRLQRRVRASVHIAAMRVKEALDKAGIEYDMNYRKSVGGLESAIFTVYAPRSRLYGIVKPHKGLDYIVSIKTVYRTRLNIRQELKQSNRPIIVGVDPGITTGLAVLDLNGRPIYLSSSKGLDRGSIIEEISKLGKPIVFAVDVAEVPESVRWLAAKFGAAIYSPPVDLEASEKREIAARILGKPPVDTHQRDALAAAYKAFQLMRRKLDHVERELKKMGVELDVDKVKESVIRGVTLAEAIERAIEDILNPQQSVERSESVRPEAKRRLTSQAPDYQYLVDKVEMLEAEKMVLERKIREFEKKLRAAELEVSRIKREVKSEVLKDEEVRRLRERIRLLEAKIDEMEKQLNQSSTRIDKLKSVLVKIHRGDVILLRPLQSLTPRSIRKSEESMGSILPGEIIFLPQPASIDKEAFKILKEASVRGVVVRDENLARTLKSYGIPAIPTSEIPGGVERVEDLYIAPGIVVDLLDEIAKEIEEARRKEIDLERLIQEYRSSRLVRNKKTQR
ncbi:MAG: DUF460 domain-containing protein [Desulfurococcales archaeon]|nr:DUF460 domain-containing protein [Desulfurococcales archaeon]